LLADPADRVSRVGAVADLVDDHRVAAAPIVFAGLESHRLGVDCVVGQVPR
jgi:hypothetical protein